MDPFTEKLLERTRARRENLQKKMAERPTAANRHMGKRVREPLALSNTVTESAPENAPPSSKPSPSKRRCSGDTELSKAEVENVEPAAVSLGAPAPQDPPTDRKPPPGPSAIRSVPSLERNGDAGQLTAAQGLVRGAHPHSTPAGPSAMRSRLQKLAEQRQYWDTDDVIPDSTPAPPPETQRQEVAPAPTPTSSDTPLGRRGRLANLAASIGSWEDDLGAQRDNAQAKPGTACLPASLHGAAGVAAQTGPAVHRLHPGQAAANKPIITGQQQSACSPAKVKVAAQPSPQKAQCSNLRPAPQPGPAAPSAALSAGPRAAHLSSPRKIGAPAAAAGLRQPPPQSPQKNQMPARDLGSGRDVQSSPKKPDLLAKPLVAASSAIPLRETTPLQAKTPSGAQSGPGVKSFLERFGERCQERSAQNSPSTAAGQKTPLPGQAATPRTRLMQEKLKTTPVVTATADLAQKQRLERESELAQLRNRFQRENVQKASGVTSAKQSTRPTESSVMPTEPKDTPTAPPVETLNTATKFCSSESLNEPAASSPLKTAGICSKMSEDNQEASVGAREVDMIVDAGNSSEVINKLFDGVLEESEDHGAENEEEDEDEEGDEDALNISSMSLLAPLAETVAAVVKSPELKLLTSTPASSFREKSKTPESARRAEKLQRARVRRTRSSESLDVAEDEQNLPYSIDAYRSTRVKETARPHVKQVIVRKEDVKQKATEATPINHVSVKQKIKDLTNEMNLQQTVIHQASQALNCCTDEEHGKGSQVEAEAERLLLIATERRVALKAELDRLRVEGPKKGPGSSRAAEEGAISASKGSVTLMELRLPLKADFICSAVSKPESYFFFILIRAGAENTVATPLGSTRSALSGDALTFSTKFTLSNVTNDFEIDVEVYCLVQRRELCSEKKKKPSKSKAITPKRLLTTITKSNLHTPVMASPGGPNAVRTSSFVLVGSHKLTLASIGKNKFPLEKISHEESEIEFLGDMFQHKVPFLCPLEGHVYLKLQCEVGSQVEERGFLTMFEDVSGFGAWHRRWCVLSGYCISYWTYPDDEKRKSPMGRVNLANCTSRKVEPANREFCARPNTFELVTVRPQREDDKETLVSRCKNTMCVTKNWLSADTKEERNLWMQKLNQILVDLRMWQPDSCYRPL
ncbi:anillin isoform X2 [Brienomyrus brachyistius]|uniref:anillin isoform X2 n=1 Tax=Brienomyrus brachyistius TaxID=42636 RepID=UPI0020B27C9B|nr:anillin isoform X2 [Brienomyrus brachyistius]